MKQRICEDEVGAAFPIGRVTLEETHVRQPSARRGQHLRGSIDADEITVEVSVGKRLRREAGAAAKVHDSPARPLRYPRQQVYGWTIPLGIESAVGQGVPVVHFFFTLLNIFRTRHNCNKIITSASTAEKRSGSPSNIHGIAERCRQRRRAATFCGHSRRDSANRPLMRRFCDSCHPKLGRQKKIIRLSNVCRI